MRRNEETTVLKRIMKKQTGFYEMENCAGKETPGKETPATN